MIRAAVITLVSSVVSLSAFAQEAEVAPRESEAQASAPVNGVYVPINSSQRLGWIVEGSVGPRSLSVGVLSSAWQTAWNTPEEWNRTWSGMGKRYAARVADVTISNALEAGLGAIWGEEPRYIPSQRRGFGPRARYAAKTVFLAPRRDGHLAPAWGRYVGNTLNNVIENEWLPPSVTTPRATIVRSVNGFLGRLIGNLYEEFWPDAHRLLRKRWRRDGGSQTS
ncbi:MAG TPA: hypothetical protein VKE51_20270 [Vicinamibacterales bacterium]|nr:hypothetical protein [Vicinamibacterales bacterium]